MQSLLSHHRRVRKNLHRTQNHNHALTPKEVES